MKRFVILLTAALLFSCGERTARSTSSADSASEASPPLIFASMQQMKDIRAGSIHNRIMGLEGDIPGGPISSNALTLGALSQSLEVRLTPETKIDEGVRITAAGSEGTEYSTKVERDVISSAGHDETVFGFYFSVPFENKPWSRTLNWHISVYVGGELVLEKELGVPAKDLIVYERSADDPFDVIDTTHLTRGRTYKVYYQNLRSDLLIAYYTSDYAAYAPFYVGKAESNSDPHFAPAFTISEQARSGAYFLTHKARAAISGADEDFPVFGYRVID